MINHSKHESAIVATLFALQATTRETAMVTQCLVANLVKLGYSDTAAWIKTYLGRKAMAQYCVTVESAVLRKRIVLWFVP